MNQIVGSLQTSWGDRSGGCIITSCAASSLVHTATALNLDIAAIGKRLVHTSYESSHAFTCDLLPVPPARAHA
jgi:hypothetical protein